MIKINLLPTEYRKVDGTPIARLVTTILGIVLVFCGAATWGYVHMVVLSQVQDEHDQHEVELAAVEAQAERSRALLREFKEYQRRRETIEKVGSSRILWSRKLDEFADLIHNKGDTKRHFVWLSSLRTQTGRAPGSPVGLQFHGWSGGDYKKLGIFNGDIKESEAFFPDFIGVDPPEGKAREFEDELIPSSTWEFTWAMDLKPSNWREKQ